MLLELGLHSFDTLMFNCRVSLSHQCHGTQNVFIALYVSFIQPNFLCSFYCLCVCAYVPCLCVVFLVFMCFYGLMPEINAFIHSFIHSFDTDNDERRVRRRRRRLRRGQSGTTGPATSCCRYSWCCHQFAPTDTHRMHVLCHHLRHLQYHQHHSL